jgi:hypothetical protein
MRRRSVFAALALAVAGFLLPMPVLAKEATVTLEISGMTLEAPAYPRCSLHWKL